MTTKNILQNFTTREEEQKRNINAIWFCLIFSTSFTLLVAVIIWINVPHCYNEIKEDKIIFEKWTKWSDGKSIDGEKVYCDEWLSVYRESIGTYQIYNFNMEKDGICIFKIKKRICK